MESQVGSNEVQKSTSFFFNLLFKLLRVEVLGAIGFVFAGSAAVLPGSELNILPNALIRINFGIAIGLIFYVFCWIIAYYRILAQKTSDEIKELRYISGFFGILMIFLGRNLLLSFAVYIFIYAVIIISQRLVVKSVDGNKNV